MSVIINRFFKFLLMGSQRIHDVTISGNLIFDSSKWFCVSSNLPTMGMRSSFQCLDAMIILCCLSGKSILVICNLPDDFFQSADQIVRKFTKFSLGNWTIWVNHLVVMIRIVRTWLHCSLTKDCTYSRSRSVSNFKRNTPIFLDTLLVASLKGIFTSINIFFCMSICTTIPHVNWFGYFISQCLELRDLILCVFLWKQGIFLSLEGHHLFSVLCLQQQWVMS